MNAQAQMSGQLPGRVPNQSNQQMAGLPNQKGFALPPQMQSLAAHSIDRDLENHRERVRNSLVHVLQKRTNDPTADWVHKIPEFAKRLEDELYKYAHSKEDYMNMNTATMEQRLQGIVKNLPINGRPLPHHLPAESVISAAPEMGRFPIPNPDEVAREFAANKRKKLSPSTRKQTIASSSLGVQVDETEGFVQILFPKSLSAYTDQESVDPIVEGLMHNDVLAHFTELGWEGAMQKVLQAVGATRTMGLSYVKELVAFKKSYAEMKTLADRRDAQACELLAEVERLKKELEEAKAAEAELAATLESQLQAKDAEIATITVDANSSLVDIVFKTRGQVMKDIKEGKCTQQQINDIAIDYDNLMAEEEDDDEGVAIDDAEGADGRSQGVPPNETPLVDGKETDVESDPGAAA